MISKVYILGTIKDASSLSTQNKFLQAKYKLEKMNIEAFNPVESYLMYPKSKDMARKYNIQKLLASNAIYILNEESNYTKNQIEIILALEFNILIMHEF